jgi:1-acyl-sn-glycerol-3-phosphate acyltransferase
LRLVLLLLTLGELFLRFALLRTRKRKLSLQDRAAWMHASCALVLRRLGIALSFDGPLPKQGLIVSNHLSYFDILLHAAVGPCVFVSKSEVRSWPGFGALAACGGTIFIERGRRASAAEAALKVEYALRTGLTVIFFPEGTSTDGTTLLPFHPFLFEPAVLTESTVTAAALRYQALDAEECDLCYYGDIHFVPHLLEMMGRKEVCGRIRFDSRSRIYSSRKQAANDTWERVARLRLRADMDPFEETMLRMMSMDGSR